MTKRLEDLPNIGPSLAGMLREIDIATPDALRAVGVVETYARLKFRFPRAVALNALWAMDATLSGIDWRQLGGGAKRS